MKNKGFLLFLSLAGIFTACEEESGLEELDLTSPVISLTGPVEGAEFFPGQFVPVKATVADETDLGQVMVSLQGPGNIRNSYTRKDRENGISFEEGKTDFLDFTFPLADNLIPGAYILSVEALDEQGNQAEAQSVTILILNEDQEEPEITFTEPIDGSIYAIAETIPVSASVTDNELLREIRISLSQKDAQPVIEKKIKEFNSGAGHLVQEEIQVLPEFPSGDYLLTIEAEDQAGNTQSGSVTISIVEEPAGNE